MQEKGDNFWNLSEIISGNPKSSAGAHPLNNKSRKQHAGHPA